MENTTDITYWINYIAVGSPSMVSLNLIFVPLRKCLNKFVLQEIHKYSADHKKT